MKPTRVLSLLLLLLARPVVATPVAPAARDASDFLRRFNSVYQGLLRVARKRNGAPRPTSPKRTTALASAPIPPSRSSKGIAPSSRACERYWGTDGSCRSSPFVS